MSRNDLACVIESAPNVFDVVQCDADAPAWDTGCLISRWRDLREAINEALSLGCEYGIDFTWYKPKDVT